MVDENIEEKLSDKDIQDLARTNKIVKWLEIGIPLIAFGSYGLYKVGIKFYDFISKIPENHPRFYETCANLYDNFFKDFI